jgi:hypothetical protein
MNAVKATLDSFLLLVSLGFYKYAAPNGAGDASTIAQPFMAWYRVKK